MNAAYPNQTDWLDAIFATPELLAMGHAQRAADRNLGLGWLYYGLARLLRPRRAVCIGSWRGFVPILLGQALRDNGEDGRVIFIDPSLVDDHWLDPGRTRDWFARFGLDNIDHYRSTTQDFLDSPAYRQIERIGLLFIDGYHSAEQARLDHQAFAPLLDPEGVILFHDSIRERISTLYGAEQTYVHTVWRYISELKIHPEWQVMDFPQGSGVTLVRRAAPLTVPAATAT
jgi:predicted O-methyltransferase YrrM